jgi:hypothetical protein
MSYTGGFSTYRCLCGKGITGGARHDYGSRMRLSPDFQPPGIRVGRFADPAVPSPGYAGAAGLLCYLFPVAAVYAASREQAEAFADAHGLRGPEARAYCAELSS